MGTLEQVMQMRKQGQSDSRIIDYLRQQGISPKEINEALSQSKIKSALNEQDVIMQQTQYPLSTEIQPSEMDIAQMQPSMMQIQKAEEIPLSMQETAFQPSATIPQSQEAYQYPTYPQYQEYVQYPEYSPESSIETINEIAEQLIAEKTSELKKQVSSLLGFKDEISLELEKINERLLKIENTLNELQMAIIGKIGEYGQDIKNIAKEMHATQDSFSKILNPLTDNIREMQRITGKDINKPRPKTTDKSKKEKVNFEDYLR